MRRNLVAGGLALLFVAGGAAASSLEISPEGFNKTLNSGSNAREDISVRNTGGEKLRVNLFVLEQADDSNNTEGFYAFPYPRQVTLSPSQSESGNVYFFTDHALVPDNFSVRVEARGTPVRGGGDGGDDSDDSDPSGGGSGDPGGTSSHLGEDDDAQSGGGQTGEEEPGSGSTGNSSQEVIEELRGDLERLRNMSEENRTRPEPPGDSLERILLGPLTGFVDRCVPPEAFEVVEYAARSLFRLAFTSFVWFPASVI